MTLLDFETRQIDSQIWIMKNGTKDAPNARLHARVH